MGLKKVAKLRSEWEQEYFADINLKNYKLKKNQLASFDELEQRRNCLKQSLGELVNNFWLDGFPNFRKLGDNSLEKFLRTPNQQDVFKSSEVESLRADTKKAYYIIIDYNILLEDLYKHYEHCLKLVEFLTYNFELQKEKNKALKVEKKKKSD